MPLVIYISSCYIELYYFCYKYFSLCGFSFGLTTAFFFFTMENFEVLHCQVYLIVYWFEVCFFVCLFGGIGV
jgi:hypothetical protein